MDVDMSSESSDDELQEMLRKKKLARKLKKQKKKEGKHRSESGDNPGAGSAPPPRPRVKPEKKRGNEVKHKSPKKRKRSDDKGSSSSNSRPATSVKRSPSGSSQASKKRSRPSTTPSDSKRAPKKTKRKAVKREDQGAARPTKKPRTRKPKTEKKKVKKQLPWAKKVDRAIMAFKWWEAKKHKHGARWVSLEHCGVMFPEPYKPHGVKMLYDGEPVALPPNAEEVATFYAQVDPEGPQLGDAKIAKLFNKNFFRDFKNELPRGHPIKLFNKCDFSPLRRWVKEQKAIKDARTKEEKSVIKRKNATAKALHAYAFVDGHIEKLANCVVEPPNLFRGRGLHPKTGTYKRRVMPEDITINVSKEAVVPACPMPGHSWKGVVHDPSVTWLATWNENVMNGHKYVFLAASSGFKGEADLKKYEKARELKKYIAHIRKTYERMLKKKEVAARQMGTAMWVIDVLALRVGNEKDDQEADTVGCCSLRVEHLTIQEHAITFDFLGKDSMRYFETIDFVRYGDIGKQVLENFRSFCKSKKPAEQVFEHLTPTILNRKLNELMPGLSAKVFRTYNASVTLEKELQDVPETKTPQEKGVVYDAANRQVAILCNHQRTVPKTFAATFGKLEGRRDHMKKQIAELKRMKKQIRSGEEVKLKEETDDKAKNKRQNHLFKRQPSEEQVVKRLATFTDRLRKLQLSMKQKDDNKTVALGTSKINYMDPRITVAWCKRVSCPIEKVFSAALRDKFPWAMSAGPDFKF